MDKNEEFSRLPEHLGTNLYHIFHIVKRQILESMVIFRFFQGGIIVYLLFLLARN